MSDGAPVREGGHGGVRDAVAVAAGVAFVAIVGLALAEALDVTLLVDPAEVMAPSGVAAGVGVLLLVVDVVLPVPSSVVMLAHGALFGVVPGAALSLLGRAGNAVLGVVLGRAAGRALRGHGGGRRGYGDRGTELVRRWGLAAVVLTRPVPVLAESTLVAAAALGLPAPAVVTAAVAGAVPEAVLYALAGDVAASHTGAAVVFVAVGLLAVAAWITGARVGAARTRPETTSIGR